MIVWSILLVDIKDSQLLLLYITYNQEHVYSVHENTYIHVRVVL